MICKETTAFIHEFLDHELPQDCHAAVRTHLEECPSCWCKFEFERELRTVIGEKGRSVAAPAYVFERVRRNVHGREKKRSAASRSLSWLRVRPVWAWGAAFILIVGVGGAWILLGGGGGASPLIAELVGDHIRYAEAQKPSEMVSSDVEELERWLESRLGYGIAVPRFNASEVRLIGGRLLDLKGKKVAYLFYQEGKHALSLYVAKGSETELCADDRFQLQDCRLCLVQFYNCELCFSRHRNYNVLSWQEGGVMYAMVSDLDSERMLDVTCPRNIPS